jgi:hypothetical protein
MPLVRFAFLFGTTSAFTRSASTFAILGRRRRLTFIMLFRYHLLIIILSIEK